MKQVQMADYGSADVLQLIDAPIPQPQQGEIQIEVKAIGVNYSDILRRRNTYFMPTPLPFVLGTEAVGIVRQLGPGVTADAFPLGAKVLAILPAGGGYAEYVSAPAAYCVPLPPNVDDQVATAIFVQGTTAYLLLHQVAPAIKEQTVLIQAASGGVGSLLVQLAKLAGAKKVIAASSSEEKLRTAQALGADVLVNYAQANWTEQLLTQNEGEKVDLILEMVGGTIFQQSFEVLKPGGAMLIYGAASGEAGTVASEHLVDENFQLRGFNLAHFIQQRTEEWQAALGQMIALVASGQIQVQVAHQYPLAEAPAAHRDIEARKTVGKVVLTT